MNKITVMKRICIIILLVLTCFNQLFAPNLGDYPKQQKEQEFDIISRLNEVLTEDLKEYNKFVKYKEYNKLSLKKAVHRILVIKAIGLTETNLDMVAYSALTVRQKVDKTYNKKEQAVGLLQIRPIMYRHLTQVLKLCNYGINDRWQADKSISMFILFQDHYNPTWNIEIASRDWNGGGGLGMKKSTTLEYYKKFYSNYKKLQEQYFASR